MARRGSLWVRRGEDRDGERSPDREVGRRWCSRFGSMVSRSKLGFHSAQRRTGAPGARRERPGRAQLVWKAGAAVLETALLSRSCRRGLGYSSVGAGGPRSSQGGREGPWGPRLSH